jgi:predicted O-methyltransferase YrrM
MNDFVNSGIPAIHKQLMKKCADIGFTMPSDLFTGSLLKTLIASKPNSKILEIGTGIGLSLSWMIEGMDDSSELWTIDNDEKLISIAREFFGRDKRVNIICADGSQWINTYQGDKFDLIFADAWPGKYADLEQTLALLLPGGIYVIDDMAVQPNWPKGHEGKVIELINTLEKRKDLQITKMNWSTGIIVAVKRS